MGFLIRNIIIICAFTVLSSCTKQNNTSRSGGNSENLKSADSSLNKDTMLDAATKSLYKQVDNQPDYVPPKNGGNNKKWNCNRNKVLTKDSNCYFGKGLQKRHRYRHGWQNSE